MLKSPSSPLKPRTIA